MSLVKQIYKTYAQAYSGLPKEAWMLAAVELINRSGTMVFFFMTLYMTQKLGYSTTAAGQAISIYGFGALAGAYLGGRLSDLWGAYTVQKVSLLLTGFTLILLGQVTTLPAIFATVFTLGVVSETLHPANSTAFSQICPPEIRNKGFALNRLATNLGVTIGPALGGVLAMIDYQYLFWVDGLTCLAAAGFFFIFFKAARPLRTEEAQTPQAPCSPWRDRYFLKILGLVLINGLVFVQLFSTFPLYFKEFYGFQENRIGFLLAINTVIIVLFEMVLINALNRKPPVKLAAIGTLLLGGGFALMPLGRGFLFAAFTVAVWTMGEMLFMPAITTVIANNSDDLSRGTYMGIFSVAFASAMVVGPSIGAFVYDRLGGDILWLFSGLAGLVMFFGFSALARSRKRIESAVGQSTGLENQQSPL